MPKKPTEPVRVASFGERLRRARSARGKTLRQVAGSAGVSIAYLSDLERGVLENPTLDKLRGIAAALSISLNDLLDVREPSHVPSNQEPPALQEFTSGEPFRSVTAEQAKRLRRDPGELRERWVEILRGIDLGGLQPETAADYAFIFEAIRHAIDRR